MQALVSVSTHTSLCSAEFLHYVILQLGQPVLAALELDRLRTRLESQDSDVVRLRYVMMLARHHVETEAAFPCDTDFVFVSCARCSMPGMGIWRDQAVAAQALLCGLSAARQGDAAT